MIYCVVPAELEDELYEKLVAYYEGNDRVTVVVDRRSGGDRRREQGGRDDDRRSPGDRRRRGAGGFVSTHVQDP